MERPRLLYASKLLEVVEDREDMGGDREVLLFGAAADSDGADNLPINYEGDPAGHYRDA